MNNLYIDHQEQQLESLNKESLGPGLYMLDISKKLNKICYPWAPTVRLQKMGDSINKNMSLIDTESELYNITRINSNNPCKKYIPDENKKIDYQDLPDGFFHEENTYLTNPPFELKGQTKNRFYNLFHDPQKTAIEPFNRNGVDTYSLILDDYKPCPFNKSMYDGF